MKAHSVSWLHGGRVYSTQWAAISAGAAPRLPGEPALGALGRAYFRYMGWFSPGIRIVTGTAGDVEYRFGAWRQPVLAFGAPRVVRQPRGAWISYPIVGGLETARASQAEPESGWSSVPGDPVGSAGLLRIAAREQEDGLWLGVELEAFNPAFSPQSLPYRFGVLPVHTSLSKGFVRWWLRRLALLSDHAG